MSIEREVRKAVEGIVKAAIAPAPLYAHPPANMALPAVTLDRIISEPDDYMAEAASRVTITFTTWSKVRGPRELEDIHGKMKAALHNVALTLASGGAPLIRWSRDDITRDADGVTYIGSILVQCSVEE